MMKLDYAGGQVLLSDALCHALLNYSADIARTGGSENLHIPVMTVDGIRGLAEVVVGPASQLLATPTDAAEVDLDDSQAIDDIVARSAALQPSQGMPVAHFDLRSDLEGQT
jgi:hypothetical protein